LPLSKQPKPQTEAFPRSSILTRLRKRIRQPERSLPRSLADRVRAVAEPAGAVFQRELPAQAQNPSEAITVLSANLCHDWPWRRQHRQRLEAFAQLAEAKQANLLLLQEVARTCEFRADEWLAQRLGMGYVYARANGHEVGIGFEEGLAVLSRFPLKNPRLRAWSSRTNPFVRRLALGVTLDLGCRDFMASSVHLGLLPWRNAAQALDLWRWISQEAGAAPALVGGDFNAPEHSAQIARAQRTWLDTFRHQHPAVKAATHELRLPWGQSLHRRRLDYVFLHPGDHAWTVVAAEHLVTPGIRHSDHQVVLARLRPEIHC
jgi:endonuclease/exonuclease/phosphatase family metal-dependent hydrolase